MSKLLFRAGVVAASLALVSAAAAVADLGGNEKVWCAGDICVTDDGGIAPDKLPKRGRAPITARLNGEIETRDGAHPPAVETLDLDVDRTIDIDAVGLPVCRASQLTARSTAAAKRVCGDAIVGSGETEVEVAFPEQTPFRSSGPLLLFNGGVQGATTTLFLHAYVDVPAPTAVIVEATVTRVDRGRYGFHISAKIPKIAGGAGSATMFDLKVGRRYAYEGKRKSLLVAGCPTGVWLTKGAVRFSDGTRLGIVHPFSCTPQG